MLLSFCANLLKFAEWRLNFLPVETMLLLNLVLAIEVPSIWLFVWLILCSNLSFIFPFLMSISISYSKQRKYQKIAGLIVDVFDVFDFVDVDDHAPLMKHTFGGEDAFGNVDFDLFLVGVFSGSVCALAEVIGFHDWLADAVFVAKGHSFDGTLAHVHHFGELPFDVDQLVLGHDQFVAEVTDVGEPVQFVLALVEMEVDSSDLQVFHQLVDQFVGHHIQ